MSLPNNNLVNVQTYQKSDLALLLNMYFFINKANKKYKNFQNLPAQLGQTVTFDKPPRATTVNNLVAQFQPAVQRVQSLTVDQQISSSFDFTSQQYVYNGIEEYIKVFGRSAMTEMGSQIESNVANLAVTNTYRFYGNGVTSINSFLQLAEALAQYRNYGAPRDTAECVIPDISVPAITNSGLSQFAMTRNNELANSWELGSFGQANWNISNLLPVHYAGTEGVEASILTVVSTTLDANGAVTAITFSGTNAANDTDSIKQYDKLAFFDNVPGFQNMRYLTWFGYRPSSNPVQIRATANATSTAGSQVTVSIYPPLQVNATQDRNINQAIMPGMQARVLPSHRAGLIYSGSPLYLAMPQLPDQSPFTTANSIDEYSGASIRRTEGALFGQNQMGTVYDSIWGATLVDEYALMVAFPL